MSEKHKCELVGLEPFSVEERPNGQLVIRGRATMRPLAGGANFRAPITLALSSMSISFTESTLRPLPCEVVALFSATRDGVYEELQAGGGPASGGWYHRLALPHADLLTHFDGSRELELGVGGVWRAAIVDHTGYYALAIVQAGAEHVRGELPVGLLCTEPMQKASFQELLFELDGRKRVREGWEAP